MLNRIVDAALNYRLLVLVGLALIVALGARAWYQLPVDAFPDVTPVQVSVITESPGLSPEDVERLITFPVESSLAGLPGVQVVRSLSLFGLSSVTVFFEDNVDIYFARRLVGERLQQAKERIPAGFGEPELGPNASGLGQVFWYTVESADGKWSNMDLRTLHDWTVRVQLRTAPGVDEVISWGGEEKQFQVLVDPNRLVKYGLGLKNVVEALSGNNQQVGGQYINMRREQYLVRGLGLVAGAADLAEIPLASSDGTPVYLRDVADIREAGGLRFGAVTRDGREVVLGMTLQRIGENAKKVVAGVKAKLARLEAALPEGVKIHIIYDRTVLVDHAVSTATRALAEGGLLVAIMLFLFLGEVRSALVVISSLPLAMLIAFMLMTQVGLSGNLMSLAGLAVAIGMMIDGAVVLVENAYRLLSHSAATGESRLQVVRRAAFEVARPVAFAILIIIVVFLPLFSLTEIEGKLFKPMAYAITFAMLGSLALTLTVIPVLASLLLKPRPERDTFLFAWAKRVYEPLLLKALERKKLFLAAGVALLLLASALMPFFGREFLPALQEGAFLFRMSAIPSTSLDESLVLSKRAEQVLRGFPQTRTALSMIGRAERGEPEDVNRIETLVELKDRHEWPGSASYQDLAHEMQEALEKALPSVVIAVGQPIQHRVDELISGVRAPLVLRIYGENLETLDRLSAETKDVLEGVRGASDLAVEANRGKPQITVSVNRSAATRYGLSVEEILEIVRAGVGGKAVGAVFDGPRRFDIQVWLKPEFRSSVEAIGNLPLRTRDGALVPLSRVSDIRVSEGYSFIRHDSLQRNVVVQMDVRGRDVNGFVRDADAAMKQKIKLPPGYVLQWGGAFENQQRAMARLAIIVPLTIGLIFILLYTMFNSVALAALVIANVPFALVGGVLALFISGQYLSVPSVVGFIAVLGVAMLNGIVLVSFINEQLERGLSIRDAVRQGAMLRLRPVLMTASVTILGILPMLLSTGVGAETQRPLATVIVGGLMTSTALTLLLLPAMYEWLANYRQRRGAGV